MVPMFNIMHVPLQFAIPIHGDAPLGHVDGQYCILGPRDEVFFLGLLYHYHIIARCAKQVVYSTKHGAILVLYAAAYQVLANNTHPLRCQATDHAT